jgi:glucokinase
MIKLFSRSQAGIKTEKGWYGHVDGGGTYARILIAEKGSGKTMYEHKFTCADYESIDEIISIGFREAGGVPDKMVFALAGPIDLEKQRVKFTNRPGWPDFHLQKLERATGVEGVLVNDMQLIAADAAWTDQKYLTVIKKGKLWPEGRVLVHTWSTGVNSAIAENGGTVALETGFGATIAPQSSDESSFSRFVAENINVPFPTPEHLLGGARGLNLAPEWLMSIGGNPSPETLKQLQELKVQNKGLGPAITGGADTDPFCQRILKMYGGLYGTYLRDLLATYTPTGGLHLVGTINIVLAEKLADPKVSPMIERIDDPRFDDPKVPHNEMVKNATIVVNRDETLLSRGARVLAR